MKENWDLYYKNGAKTGVVIPNNERIPIDCYHLVIEIFLVTVDKKILITRRSTEKKWWPGLWETTQGSVISGETIKQGAIRELVEETGILIDENNLIPVFKYVHEDNPSIYIGFLTIANKVSAEMKVIINELEIMEYRFIDYNELIKFMNEGEFVEWSKERFLNNKEIIDFWVNYYLNN